MPPGNRKISRLSNRKKPKARKEDGAIASCVRPDAAVGDIEFHRRPSYHKCACSRLPSARPLLKITFARKRRCSRRV